MLVIIATLAIALYKKEKEKNIFFHTMAHKFRSPISIIKWYVELLSDESAGNINDKQKQYFAEICKASEKLNETIEFLTPKRKNEKGKIANNPNITYNK